MVCTIRLIKKEKQGKITVTYDMEWYIIRDHMTVDMNPLSVMPSSSAGYPMMLLVWLFFCTR